jgi:GNAT superfamily N-acetyltransferase
MPETPREIIVRPSVEDDVPAMLAIYIHHIQRGLGEFDVEPLHPDDIKHRRKNMLKRRLPHLVAELNGLVIGYAYAVPFRKRPAYRYAVKNSIYVHPDHLHAGVGRKLLPALIEACAGAGFRQMPDDRLCRRRQHALDQPSPSLCFCACRPAQRGRLQIRTLDRRCLDAAPARPGQRRAAAGPRPHADCA